MKLGKSRFEFQLDKIDKLFAEAKVQEDPAQWLFTHDLRTPAFMLEGLSKMYAAHHNKPLFKKLNEKFKTLEDILGGIDYYAAFSKEFEAAGRVPAPIIKVLDAKSKEKIQLLNEILKKDHWLDGKGVEKIKTVLKKADWLPDKKEISLFKKFYKKEIEEIQKFVGATNFVFTDVESDIHELRRKIRWLSIYPQALQGAIQLKSNKRATNDLKKYLTEKIVTSPYNQLPKPVPGAAIMCLEKNYFLALSWMISTLGVIKDDGLRVEALKEALQQKKKMSDTRALAAAHQLLGEEYPTTQSLLNHAAMICKDYFSQNYLNGLVID